MLQPPTERNDDTRTRRFRLYAWGVLLYNLPVILWGAVVRASGSGAGCGSHWPLCDGQAIPLLTNQHRLIEFTHRLSSGFVLPLTLLLCIWAWRLYPGGHLLRKAALASFLFTISEALIGAGLVLFKLVAHNDTAYRALAISAHLVNTFLLLGALSLTVWWSAVRPAFHWRAQGSLRWLLVLGALGALLLGMTGSVTALGDTLFPAGSSADIGRQVSATAHFLVRLRVYHPLIAIGVGLYLVTLGFLLGRLRPTNTVRSLAYVFALLFVTQIAAGFTNLYLLAPIGMQMVHLLFADILWITLVLLGAAVCAVPVPLMRTLTQEEMDESATPSIPSGTRTIEGTP